MPRRTSPALVATLVSALALVASRADAQDAPVPDAGTAADATRTPADPSPTDAPPPPPAPRAAPARPLPAPAPAPPVVQPASRASVTLGGWIEAFYQFNFDEPSNGITNFRGFDNRHNSFTLANVALDTTFAYESVSGHLTLQWGHTPESYYAAEPSLPGASGAGATNAAVWKFLQQANVGWRAPLGRGLLFEAGLFLSPIGCEGFAIKDQWNWSRSNLFFGLPYYHTGVRATYALTSRASVSLAGYNGWNSLVDNNPEKSIAAQFTYAIPDRLSLSVVYFGGVERGTTDAMGNPRSDRPWRHLLDAWVQWFALPRLALMLQIDGGIEQGNAFGTPAWFASAAYARVKLFDWWYIAGRADVFFENVPSGESPIFWASAPWVTSGTVTLDFRPHDNVSLRLEYRHDVSGTGPVGSTAEHGLFFRDRVATDATGSYVTNAQFQDTITAGATTWF